MITELTIKDIQCFYGCCRSTAIERVKEIKNALGVLRKGRILINHLAIYEGITVSDVRFILLGG